MTTLENAIREAEEKLAEARQHVADYKALLDRWTTEVAIAARVLAGLRSAAGIAPNEPSRPPVWKPEPVRQLIGAEPAKEEVQPKAASTFPPAVVPNGFDRLAAKRLCRTWHIRYPIAPSVQNASAFERQALTRAIVDSDDYDAWLSQGGVPLTSNKVHADMGVRLEAAAFCGVNVVAIRREARKACDDIMVYGVKGEDYL